MIGLRVLVLSLSLIVGLSAGARGRGSNNPSPNVGTGDGSQNSGPSNSGSADSEKCLDHGKVLDVMNDRALQWKEHQSSGFKTRALISGVVDEVFPDQTGHRHFSIKIGPQVDDHIEVIYNEGFGSMPVPRSGESVQACGDFIVATESNGGYPPSPDGALIHWVHKSPHPASHDSGYVILSGTLYGNGSGN